LRIVLDTNVLVSGLLNPHGPPGRIVDIVVLGELTLLVDDRILAEYEDVIRRPKFGFDISDIWTLTLFIENNSEHISAPPLDLRLKDPADLPFIEVAVAGAADALVTGNAKHFTPQARKTGLTVLSPAHFIDRLTGSLRK